MFLKVFQLNLNHGVGIWDYFFCMHISSCLTFIIITFIFAILLCIHKYIVSSHRLLFFHQLQLQVNHFMHIIFHNSCNCSCKSVHPSHKKRGRLGAFFDLQKYRQTPCIHRSISFFYDVIMMIQLRKTRRRRSTDFFIGS